MPILGSMTVRTTVFIAEDSPSIRVRLVEMLGQLDGVGVVGDAETPGEAISGILRTNPDYVVLDYQLNGGTAVDVLRAVRPKTPATIFLVLTNHTIPQYRRLCLDEGASGFFDKSLEFEKVLELIAAANPAQRE
ncbi:MAG: response regulator [Casimicrobiaceae bacterium]